MTTVSILLIVLVISINAGCSSYRVKTDYEPETNFLLLRSFSWLKETNSADVASPPSPLLIARIKRAVNQHLANKNYQLVNTSDSADFLVSFVLESKVRTGVRSYPSSYSALSLSLHHSHFFADSNFDTYQYTEGSISIDFYNSDDKSPIWRGSADKNFTGFNADVSEKTVTKVVNDILQNFPPKLKL